jgi:hypothetical protein
MLYISHSLKNMPVFVDMAANMGSSIRDAVQVAVAVAADDQMLIDALPEDNIASMWHVPGRGPERLWISVTERRT